MLQIVSLNRTQMITATAVVIVTIFAYCAWKKLFGKAKVNCWFCNTNSVVPYTTKNSWTCLNCQQYNGFTKNGDYNNELPRMHDESLNVSQIGSKPRENYASVTEQHLKLCSKCSRNQLLKVKQISQFEPITEENFDEEVTIFKRKLEKLYALCPKCQSATDRHIKMQDTIIRGSIKARQQCQNFKIQNKKSSTSPQVTERRFVLILWFSNFVLSIFVAGLYVQQCIKNIAPIPIPSFVLGKYFMASDLLDSLPIIGISSSILALIFHRRICNAYYWSTLLWILVWFVIYSENQYNNLPFTSKISNYAKQLAPYFPSSDANTNGNYFQLVLYILSFIYKPLLMVTSSIMNGLNYRYAKKLSPNSFKQNWAKSKPRKKTVRKTMRDQNMFSDDELYSEKGESPPHKKPHKNPDLNGSLNALNLKDKSQSVFKQPSTCNTNTLSSALHTPPPSRSSSLLSLSSGHQGGAKSDFARFSLTANSVPFQRYTSTVINAPPARPNIERSVASFPAAMGPALSWQKSSQLLSVANMSSKSEARKTKRPLISPAKLNWSSQQKRSQVMMNFEFDDTIMEHDEHDRHQTSWEQKSEELDISVYDSVSQAGDGMRLDLSDDDNLLPHTPLHRPKHGDTITSSPQSTISSIASMTMKSVEKVENSRLCRWMLAFFICINLVVGILLMFEVREMRAAEQWKSQRSL